MHPTEEELNRAKQEQEGIEYNNVIMTREEINANLSTETEFVQNYVEDKLNGTDENPTHERFNEMVEEAKDEEQKKLEPEEKEEKEEKTLDGDALERRLRRRRNNQ